MLYYILVQQRYEKGRTMTRKELIEKIINQAMEEWSCYDLKDMDRCYQNTVEDLLNLLPDDRLAEMLEEEAAE